MIRKHTQDISQKLISGRLGKNPWRFSFTLIELLVVISIIGILVALLMPTLSSAKEQGRSIKCMSNLHQIGIAMNVYGDDTGRYPIGATDFFADYLDTTNVIWFYTISQRLGKADCVPPKIENFSPVLYCPSSEIQSTTNVLHSYGLNEIACNGMYPNTGLDYLPFPYAEANAHDLMLMADSTLIENGQFRGQAEGLRGYEWYLTFGGPAALKAARNKIPNPDNFGGHIEFRHKGGTRANMLFFDGHVSSVSTNEFFLRNLFPGI